MAKRRGIGPSVSFFAFQDIITAVVGIFILIILILALELAQRVEAASSGEVANIAPVAEAIETLEREVERLREEVQCRSETLSQSAELNVFNRAEKIDQLRAKNKAAANQISQIEARIKRIQAQQKAAEKNHDRLLSDAAELESERRSIDQLSGKIEDLVDRANRLVGDDSEIYRDQTEEGRFVVLVTLSGGRIELRDALTRSTESMKGLDRLDRFQDWMDTMALQRRQLYILIEPGGAADFAALKKPLADSHAVYGYSVVAADHTVRMSFELDQLP